MPEQPRHAPVGASRATMVRRLQLTAAIGFAVAVVLVAALWPRGDAPDLGGVPQRYVNAAVTAVDSGTCPGVEVDAPTGCRRIAAGLTSGSQRDATIEFTVLDTQFDVPTIDVGDHVVLLDSPSSPPEYRYAFIDFERGAPLGWLAVAFVVVVVAFGRWQGVRSLAGLAVSVVLLVAFVVPALLRDEPATLVALAAAMVIAYLALFLAHGVNIATTVALLGTVASLTVITGLAVVAANVAHLSGLGDETAQVLRVTADALDLRGLLVAGIVVGALGILDDVTVTQVSTVAALRDADPRMSARALYHRALRVGRDHVAASVNTLVLAYAGASLPLLLFFAQGTQPVARILTGELVAVEIVRTLVGSIGLILSVPLTTALAAWILTDPGNPSPAHATPEPPPPRWEDFAPAEP